MSPSTALSSSKCLTITKVCFACWIALAEHHSRRLTLSGFLTSQTLVSGSPHLVNLGSFSEPIKASIAYSYRLLGGGLTFPPFDTLLYHIGVCTVVSNKCTCKQMYSSERVEHSGIEPLLSAYQTDFLPLKECSIIFYQPSTSGLRSLLGQP